MSASRQPIYSHAARDQFKAWHAHNELLQQFYAYGVAGVVLHIGLCLSVYRQARRIALPAHQAIVVTVILFIVIRGYAGTDRFDLSFPLCSIALLSVLFAALQERCQATA